VTQWSVVRTFTIADIEELIEVRSALETLAFPAGGGARAPCLPHSHEGGIAVPLHRLSRV